MYILYRSVLGIKCVFHCRIFNGKQVNVFVSLLVGTNFIIGGHGIVLYLCIVCCYLNNHTILRDVSVWGNCELPTCILADRINCNLWKVRVLVAPSTGNDKHTLGEHASRRRRHTAMQANCIQQHFRPPYFDPWLVKLMLYQFLFYFLYFLVVKFIFHDTLL